ncbi:hypothetical protein BGZ65_001272, partial [Modicella reniformis]
NNGNPPRPFKVLQPQAALYGMGALVNSLGIEQQVHPMPEEHASTTPPSERVYYENQEQAFHYLQLNSHLYNQVPPQNRRQ